MTNLISLAVLVLFLFVFMSNNLNWSFSTLNSEIQTLDKSANDFMNQSSAFLNANLSELKIGELD
jgi:hypothetical protein